MSSFAAWLIISTAKENKSLNHEVKQKRVMTKPLRVMNKFLIKDRPVGSAWVLWPSPPTVSTLWLSLWHLMWFGFTPNKYRVRQTRRKISEKLRQKKIIMHHGRKLRCLPIHWCVYSTSKNPIKITCDLLQLICRNLFQFIIFILTKT